MNLLEAEKRTQKWVRGEINVFPDFRTETDICRGKRLREIYFQDWERVLNFKRPSFAKIVN